MYLSACIEWLFQAEHEDIADRVAAAKAAGLGGVEFHLWRNKPIDRIADAVKRTGLRVTSIVVDPRCHLANPGATDEIVRSVTSRPNNSGCCSIRSASAASTIAVASSRFISLRICNIN